MLNSFFGIHPAVVRNGTWARLRPGEKDLYIYLMEQSERYCTRELKRTDSDIENLVGAAPRTLCNARKKLQELKLIQCRVADGNKYVYVICNPETGLPYPGNPKQPLTCAKRPKQTRTIEAFERPAAEPERIRYPEAVSGMALEW